MSKISLHFNLSDPDDKRNFNMALRGDEAYHILWLVDNVLRQKLKYGNLSEEVEEHLQEIRSLLNSEAVDRMVDYSGN
jgi:hypothetical protein